MSGQDEKFMERCIALAQLGAGRVAPNPMVGAVLVHEHQVIGEGYHQQFGKAHAEVNCLNSVTEVNQSLVSASTLYVSLEPCAHYGKTPPCADLIVSKKIHKVVIGCRDIYKEVSGKGIEKLKKAGIEVLTGVLENDCKSLNKRFFTFHVKQRPYIILKWAQSGNEKISNGVERTFISNQYSNRLVHKWRSEEAGILVGRNTVLLDNPELTTRLWPGKNPVRIVFDKQLIISDSAKVYNDSAPTFIFNCKKSATENNIEWIRLNENNFLEEALFSLYQRNIQSVMVEGGRETLQSFIDAGLWDEARVITNNEMLIEKGIPAPELGNYSYGKEEKYLNDTVRFYYPAGQQTNF